MIIKDGKRYYPAEYERIVSSSGGIVYDREIWGLRSKLYEKNWVEMEDCNGATIVLGRFAAKGIEIYISFFTGEQIDKFIDEVLYE